MHPILYIHFHFIFMYSFLRLILILPPATAMRLVSFVWIKWAENGLMCCSWAWVSFELRSGAMAASNE